MDNSEKQLQQRIGILESHYQEWTETLIVEAEMQRTLEDQQRQEIIQFVRLDSLPPGDIKWLALMDQQKQQRDEFIKSNIIKHQFIRDRHKVEKLELAISGKI